MDFGSKIYIEYLFDLNKNYDDEAVEREVKKAKDLLYENLSDMQVALFEDFLRLNNKLKVRKDLGLIEFVINYLKK